mmetsp:Transcript_1437/g.1543  ORF Transcript_1437/g.1543 Transcript_1437/m.1543 type:complete len:288 (+) Transcript_1437:181-1044(+)|eukprot:CAMPEP_0198269982 /NCGR_PEP_ID=MMETSP1447-20131203/43361_1 /TAXON_ID=420782 /ORGANISM="Chaetoceros dichaeta, Strain CCMP1751" /LENGTH=287 /DNA_ID=CAMNT_0043961813 /DNA_START=170 /DNA_END=1033 /DNA_ORIENTATION=-
MGSAWFHPMTAKKRDDGTCDPSPFTLLMGTSKTTKYTPQKYETKYTGSKPILVVCTDVGGMKMKNDAVFNTGNHPVEMLVPMLHFQDAGFSFEIATPTGGAVVLETWAYPTRDEKVKSLHESLKTQMEQPKKLSEISDLVKNYSAIFIPGGHGSMISLPTNFDLGELLHEAHEQKLLTVTLCHGPAALLSTNLKEKEFAYKGYEAVCFTDKTDGMTPSIGYLPGPMPWKLQEGLEGEGMTITNTGETGAVRQDRELITGDSPNAAHNLGVFAAPIMVKYAMEQEGKK